MLRALILICGSGLLAQSVHAQDLPALKVRAVRELTIEDALPTSCFEQVITDPAGRMWLATCGDAQRNRNIHMIQFDGYSGDVHALGLEPGSAMILGGFVNDSTLLGIDITRARLFFYSVYSSEIQYYEPQDTGFVFYNVQLVRDRAFVLAVRGPDHVILEFIGSGFVVRSELENANQFESIDYISGCLRSAVTMDDQIWFACEGNAVYRFDPDNGEVSRFETPKGEYLPFGNLLNWSGQLLIGFGRPGTEDVLTFQDNALRPLRLIPHGATYSIHYEHAAFRYFIFTDRAGWLFVHYLDAFGQTHSEIINRDGRRYDYSAIIASLPSNIYSTLAGDDFTSSVYAQTGSLVFVEVRKDYGFRAFPSYPARAMLQVDQNHVLCLTDVEPVMLDLQSQTTVPPAGYEQVHGTERRNIIQDSEQNLWYVDTTKLVCFNLRSNETKKWLMPSRVENFTLYKDRILLISNGNLLEFNPGTGSFRQINPENLPDRIMGTPNTMQIARDQMWVPSSTGLWSVDLASGRIVRASINGKSDIPLLTCLLDSTGVLWLGTETAGVIRYDPTSTQAQFCDRAQGLSHNTVVGILEDQAGNLWVSTFDGVNVLNRDMKVIARFFTTDGLVGNEGNRWSQIRLADGRLVIGAVQGFTVIDPALAINRFQENPIPKLYCKSVIYTPRGTDQEITVVNPNVDKEIFQLPADRRTIELDMGTSDYITSDLTEYQYLIDRDGYPWVSIGNAPGIVITNLPSGDYDILVRAVNAKGIWSENAVRISVSVAKPFYFKWWFFALCAAPFLGYLILWAWRVRVERRHLESEVRKRTAQIEAQAEELRQLDQAKTRIYTNITHEFRTPLTVIRGTSELIEGSDEKRQVIRRNSDRLLNLVNQMLELSKLESGNLVARMVSLNIVHLIRDIFESFNIVAGDKDVGMHFYAHPQEIVMDCDLEIIHRIAGNLLSNALKFTPAGGNIYVEVTQVEKEAREFVRISVRDTGIGISEDKINKIFDRFYQVDDSITRPGEGTGIGLALTRELVDFLDGSIDVRSASGSGSTFIITLPINQSAGNQGSAVQIQYDDTIAASLAPAGNPIAESQELVHDLPTALVVEDNPDVIHYLVSCLQGVYQLQIAMDGKEGVEKALQFVPDLIISDVMMPVKDGIQLCQEVKQDERTSHIPVILLTARTDVASRLEGLSRGADAYMAKPFEKEELLLTARNLIESRNAMRARYLSTTVPAHGSNPETRQEDDFILRLNALIDEHMDDEDYGVMPLSHTLKYSRAQVHNKVKALTGMSTSAYIQHRRMMHARTLLKAGQLNISEVAYAVGFRDPNYFSRVFRKEFGLSPTDFSQPDTDS